MNLKTLPVGLIILVLFISSVAWADEVPVKDEYWDRIPEGSKFHITVHDSGEETLEIAGFYFDKQTVRKATGNEWWEENKGIAMGIMQLLKVKLDKTILMKNVLRIFVKPHGSQYFWPSEFVFTQGTDQYNVNPYTDIVKLDDAITVGELKSTTIAEGFLDIPEKVDTTFSFTIWYGDDKDKMGE